MKKPFLLIVFVLSLQCFASDAQTIAKNNVTVQQVENAEELKKLIELIQSKQKYDEKKFTVYIANSRAKFKDKAFVKEVNQTGNIKGITRFKLIGMNYKVNEKINLTLNLQKIKTNLRLNAGNALYTKAKGFNISPKISYKILKWLNINLFGTRGKAKTLINTPSKIVLKQAKQRTTSRNIGTSVDAIIPIKRFFINPSIYFMKDYVYNKDSARAEEVYYVLGNNPQRLLPKNKIRFDTLGINNTFGYVFNEKFIPFVGINLAKVVHGNIALPKLKSKNITNYLIGAKVMGFIDIIAAKAKANKDNKTYSLALSLSAKF